MSIETFKSFCHDQGINFIKNFELYYDDPISNENSLKELNLIYKSILETEVIRNDSSNMSSFNLIDWFFKADYNEDIYMKQPSSIKRKTYEDFVINLLYGENIKVALSHAIEKNITYLN